MNNKKQSSIDWLIEQVKKEHPFWTDTFEQAKAKYQQEIEEAYDRKIIGDIQNWYIRDGKHYYELHYEEEQKEQAEGTS